MSKPYASHRAVPAEAMMNINRETSLVDLDFQVLITCGRNVVQESMPAVIPTISAFMGYSLRGRLKRDEKMRFFRALINIWIR